MNSTENNQAENCEELMFGGLGTGANRIEIEEDNYINLTVHPLDTSRCDINDQNAIQVKISYQDNSIPVDLCKFDLKTVCKVSDYSSSTSNCRCLNNRAVQFLKKASSSDSRYYTWTWRYRGLEIQRRIFIDVRKANLYDDTATAATTASVTCVFLGLVVAATVGVVVWMRHKAKNSREVQDHCRQFRCCRSDRPAHTQVSGQTKADDPYYSDIPEPAVSQNEDPDNADIIEQSWIQYGEVRERNTSQLRKPTYVCGREQDEGKSLDPSYEEVKRPEDVLYAHVKEPKVKILGNPTSVHVKRQNLKLTT